MKNVGRFAHHRQTPNPKITTYQIDGEFTIKCIKNKKKHRLVHCRKRRLPIHKSHPDITTHFSEPSPHLNLSLTIILNFRNKNITH